MAVFLRLVDKIIIGLAIFAGVYLVIIMIGIVFQASARSLGYSGSSHIFTFTEFGLLYIAMAAAPWLVRSRGHVYIEILTAAVPDAVRPTLSRLVTALCVIVCVTVVWFGTETTITAWQRGDADMRSIDMPRWLLLISIPISFALMAIEFARFTFGKDVLHRGEPGVHE